MEKLEQLCLENIRIRRDVILFTHIDRFLKRMGDLIRSPQSVFLSPPFILTGVPGLTAWSDNAGPFTL